MGGDSTLVRVFTRYKHENTLDAASPDECGARQDTACPSCGELNWPGAKLSGKYGPGLAQPAGAGQTSPSKFDDALPTAPDLRQVMRARYDATGIRDLVEILGVPALELGAHVGRGTIDSVLLIQSLHHLHRREDMFHLTFLGYWIPYLSRFVCHPRRRFGIEQRLGRWPIVRHFAAILEVTARRREGISRR